MGPAGALGGGSGSSVPPGCQALWAVLHVLPAEERGGQDLHPETEGLVRDLAHREHPWLRAWLEPVLQCPAHHKLKPRVTPVPGVCDGCGYDIPRGTPVLDCRGCDWYLCRECQDSWVSWYVTEHPELGQQVRPRSRSRSR
jgi:hypothetical protein